MKSFLFQGHIVLVALSILLSLYPAQATQRRLTSVKQPLYLLGTDGDEEIQIMDVPYVTWWPDPEWRFSAICAPFQPAGDTSQKDAQNVNLASLYKIDVGGTYKIMHGDRIALDVEVIIDISQASVPDGYPFTIEQVTDAVITCVKLMYPRGRIDDSAVEIKVRLQSSELVDCTKNWFGVGKTELYNKLADAYRTALGINDTHQHIEIYTKERSPQKWAQTQSSLGRVLLNKLKFGEFEDGAGFYMTLGKAETAYRTALEVYTKEKFPQEWSDAQFGLTTALVEVVRHELGNEERLSKDAENARRIVREMSEQGDVPPKWAELQNELAKAFTDIAKNSTDNSKQVWRLKEAIACYETVLTLWNKDKIPQQHQIALDGLREARQLLGESKQQKE